MLNPFPELLFLGFFAPTLLRVAAAALFMYYAYTHFHRKDELSRTHFPVVGSGAWIIWLSIVVEALVATGLLFGYSTQVAALLGALIGLKGVVWAGKFPSYFVLSRGTSFLLLVICLSLMLTGGGALAMDLPL